MTASRTHVPLILCCGDDGEVALVGVLDELHRKGHAPEVLLGVESDPATLTGAVDRIQGAALFVLCQSADLDRTHVRRLSGLFSARRGPGHQLLTVQIEAGNGLAVLPQIEAAIEALVGPRPDAADDDGYHMRDVIAPTGVSAMRREAADPRRRPPHAGEAERIARELHQEMVAAEAVLTRRKAQRELYAPPASGRGREASRGVPGAVRGSHTGAAPPPASHAPGRPPRAVRADAAPVAPSLDLPVDELVRARTEPLDPSAFAGGRPVADGVPTVVDNDRALAGAGGPAGSTATRPRPRVIVEPDIRAASAAHDSRREADERPLVAPAPMSATAAAAVTAARRRAMAEEDLERTDQIPAQTLDADLQSGPDVNEAASRSRPMGRLLLLVSGAGMAVLIGLAVTSATAPDPTAVGTRGSVQAAATTPPAQASAGPVEPLPDAADGAGADPRDGTSGVAVVADPETGAADDPKADADEQAADEGAADEADADDDDAAGHASPPSPPPTSLPPALAQAVADGRVKLHGRILFLAAPRETMTWDEADRRCRQRKIAGLGGWRLPTRGQLSRLRRGGLATAGSFWTRDVVGGDEVYAFDATSAKSSLWLKVEPNGRSLCVRRTP